jgi:hypothetical protein
MLILWDLRLSITPSWPPCRGPATAVARHGQFLHDWSEGTGFARVALLWLCSPRGVMLSWAGTERFNDCHLRRS